MMRIVSRVRDIYLQEGYWQVLRRGYDKFFATTPVGKWDAQLRKLVERDILPEMVKVQPAGKRVLFWTPMAAWPFTLVDLLLAQALRLRGWEVKMAVCDGGLPHCEMERAMFPRPSCERCWRSSLRMLNAFKIPFCRLSDYLTPEDIQCAVTSLENKSYAELAEWKVDGYAVGRFSDLYLTTYFQGPVKTIGAAELAILRRIIAGNALAYTYADRLRREYQPEVVVTLNGNLCQFQPAYENFRRDGTRVVTWESYPPYQDSYIWSQADPCVYANIDPQVWEQVKSKALSQSDCLAMSRFLKEWATGNIGDINYHPKPDDSTGELKKRLNLMPDKRLFVAFTNVVWDSACLGRDVGFNGMMDWLYELCEWFEANPKGGQLIVRVHPAEKRLPKEYHTLVGVADQLREKYPKGLPSNIRIIDATDDAYSYTLAGMADAIGVYTTSLGYELAAQGRRVWVAGEVHYRGKGFTLDLEGREHLKQLLAQNLWPTELISDELELAKRYVHFRHFRQIVRIPFMKRTQTNFLSRPRFSNLKFLLPGRDPLMSSLVDRIIDGRPFVDIPPRTKAKWIDEAI